MMFAGRVRLQGFLRVQSVSRLTPILAALMYFDSACSWPGSQQLWVPGSNFKIGVDLHTDNKRITND